MSMKPHFTRGEGVAGGKNNLKCQWVVGLSSGMARSKAESIRKRIHVPRRHGCYSYRDEVAGASPKLGKNDIFWAPGGGEMTSNRIEWCQEVG